MAYRTSLDSFMMELHKGRLIKVSCKNKSCPSYSDCSHVPVEIVGNGDVDIVFVGAAPTNLERELKRPFSDRAGMTLRNTVHRLKKVYKKAFTYALIHACFDVGEDAKGRKYRIENYVEHCSEEVQNAIYNLNPKMIMLLGGQAILSTMQTKVSIESIRSNPRKVRIKDKVFKCYATYSVGFGLSNTDRLGDIYYDIATILGRKKPKVNIKYGPGEDCDVTYKILKTVKDVKKVLGKMARSTRPLIYDIEADGIYKFNSNILSLQFYNGGKCGYLVPWLHSESPFSKKDYVKLKKIIRELFSKKSKYPFVVGHNLKYDYTVTYTRIGIEIQKPLFDTIAGAYLLDETHTKDDDDETDASGGTGGYGLGSQLLHYGLEDDWYFQAKKNRGHLANESLDYVARYGVGDVVYNWELMRCQFEEAKSQNYLKEWKNLLLNFYSYQIRLFADLEINGVLVDVEYLGTLMNAKKSPLIKFIADLKKELYTLPSVIEANKRLNSKNASVFGDVWMFDIQKPEHKQLLFIGVLGLEPLKYGKLKGGRKGAPSLDKGFQKHYMDEHREVELLFYLSRASQLFNLYPKSFHEILSKNKDCSDGRIRPSFFGIRTRSGRGAARKPNLQQTVRGGESGSIDAKLANIVRGLFTSSIGNALVKLDLMANEVRCWGAEARDAKLKASVLHGAKLREEYFYKGPDKELYKKVKLEGDLHRTNASEFNTISVAEVTDLQRQASKDTTFGTIYGLTTNNLAKRLKKTFKETQKIKKKFFGTFRNGKKWLDDKEAEGLSKLYVESSLGRRRRLWYFLAQYPLTEDSTLESPMLNKDDYFISGRIGEGERRAKNSPIQGIGSDFAFMAGFLMRKYIKENGKKWKLFNVVHDSLEAEVPVNEIKEYVLVSKIIFENMTTKFLKAKFNYDLFIPIEVDYEVGFSFREMKKWDGAYATLEKLQEEMVKATKDRKPTQDISEITLKAA